MLLYLVAEHVSKRGFGIRREIPIPVGLFNFPGGAHAAIVFTTVVTDDCASQPDGGSTELKLRNVALNGAFIGGSLG